MSDGGELSGAVRRDDLQAESPALPLPLPMAATATAPAQQRGRADDARTTQQHQQHQQHQQRFEGQTLAEFLREEAATGTVAGAPEARYRPQLSHFPSTTSAPTSLADSLRPARRPNPPRAALPGQDGTARQAPPLTDSSSSTSSTSSTDRKRRLTLTDPDHASLQDQSNSRPRQGFTGHPTYFSQLDRGDSRRPSRATADEQPPSFFDIPESRRSLQSRGRDPAASTMPTSASPPESDLPPSRPYPFRPRESSFARRDSDYTPPPWQPDSDVTNCFVCGNPYTLLNRRHHCRKCGRVVCAGCSPHRITLPNQYIVCGPSEHPPVTEGGRQVRVCNPCVPDPNFEPPPQYSQASRPTSHHAPSPLSSRPNAPFSHAYVGPNERPRPVRGPSRSVSSGSQLNHPFPGSRQDPFATGRVSFVDRSSVNDLWPPTRPPTRSPTGPMAGAPGVGAYDPNRLVDAERHRPTRDQMSALLANAYNRYNGARHAQQPAVPSPPPPGHRPPPPRARQLTDDDYCPVCGQVLPPKDSNGSAALQEQHIMECIAAIETASPAPVAGPHQTPASQTSASQTSASLPNQRTRGMSSAAATSNNSGGSSSNRASYHRAQLFPFVATEKDCVDKDGNEAECPICYVEFEAGDHLATLSCWDKFHEKCIREWWEIKGRGSCPLHMLPAHVSRG